MGNHWLSRSYMWAVKSREGSKCGFIAEQLLSFLSLLEDSSVCDPIGVVSLTDRCQSSSPTDSCCAEVPLCSLMSFSSALYSVCTGLYS